MFCHHSICTFSYAVVSEFESSGAESADDRDQSAVTYTAIQSTPTSLTITSNRNSKKTESIGTGRKRKRSRDDNKRPGKKASLLDCTCRWDYYALTGCILTRVLYWLGEQLREKEIALHFKGSYCVVTLIDSSI